jgi:hypothetical protein
MTARLPLLAGLAAASARTLPAAPLAAAAVTGLGLVLAGTLVIERPDLAGVAATLRLAAVCGALGVAVVLDDPPERTTTAAVPVPLLLRRTLRVLLVAPLAAVWWAALLWLARNQLDPAVSGALPVGRLTLEAGTLLVVAAALASAGARVTADRSGSVVAVPALLVGLVAAQTLLPARLALFVDPGSPVWTAARGRWLVVLAAALAGFVAAGRDPGGRRLGALLRLGRAGGRTRRAAARPGSGRPGRHLRRSPRWP